MVKIDNHVYNVRVVYGSLKRTFEIVDGSNAGTALSGRQIRDIIGTKFAYSLQIEPMPQHMADYYELYEVISAPQASHVIVVPYNGTTMTFAAEIINASDTYSGRHAGVATWKGLTVTFKSVAPLRTPS